jgi:hypothetical protein
MFFVRLSAFLFFLGFACLAAHAEEIAFTAYPQQIVLKVENKNYTCPAMVKIRFIPDGALFKTDFVVDTDLRGVYADLETILSGIKKERPGEHIRLYDVSRRFTGKHLIVRSKTDYQRTIMGDLQLEQTVESEVAFTPEYANGVLRLKPEILSAQLNGLAAQVGLDARQVAQLICDLFLSKEMEYRLFPQDNAGQMKLDNLAFTAKNNQFYGLYAQGSVWLTARQFNDLVKQLTGTH